MTASANIVATLTELYIEALLVNETRADKVWQSWNAGDIDNETAAISWAWIAATSGDPAVCETPAMLYSDSETAWLNRRAEKIAEERGWPLPIARSEACAELVRMRTRKPADVLPFRPRSVTIPEPDKANTSH